MTVLPGSRVPLFAAVAALLGLGIGGEANAACSMGPPESSLQQCFDTWLGAGVLPVGNRLADGADSYWTTGGVASSTVVLELAGFANTNQFGLYDPVSGSSVRIFEGSAAAGSTATIEFVAGSAGGYDVRVNGSTQGNFTSALFGFYLFVPTTGTTFYSNTAANAANPPGPAGAIDPGPQPDHLYAYRGTNTRFLGQDNGIDEVQGLPEILEGDVFASPQYILAWEDLRSSVSGYDGDFQDFVVLVKDITPVPLPAAAWLLASGLLGFGGLARRRRA
jgi:hypothetical protein